MSGHTPGPWYVECDGLPELRNVSTYVTAGWGDEHVLICQINTDPPDAALIAAAPDLLEALKRHYEQDIPFAERQALARSAIAKAEGRQVPEIGTPQK